MSSQNRGGSGDGHDHGAEQQMAQQENQPATGEARAPEKAGDVKKDMATAMNRRPNVAGEGGEANGKPKVKVEKPAPYVPQPSDVATTAQWYTQESQSARK